MALQLVESVFVSGVRYPTSAVVGTVAAPVAAPSANLPLIESVESGGVRYPTFVLVTGTAALPAGEPLIESVVYDGARYPALAIADTTLTSTEDVYSVVRGTQRFPCAVEVSGPFTSTVPNTHLTDGIVVSGVRYPAMTFSVGGTVSTNAILLESGDFLLLESGDNLLQE